MRLAANVFHCSAREMLERVDSVELAEWEAFDLLEPIDHTRRIELAIGTLCAKVHNLMRDKNADPATAADYMRDWGKEYREAVDAERAAENLWDKLDRTVMSFGG